MGMMLGYYLRELMLMLLIMPPQIRRNARIQVATCIELLTPISLMNSGIAKLAFIIITARVHGKIERGWIRVLAADLIAEELKLVLQKFKS